jgi:hypothetical protein
MHETVTNLVLFTELQVGTVFVVRQLRQGDFAPKVGCKEGIRFGNLQEVLENPIRVRVIYTHSCECCFQEVAHRGS